jgi:Uma2 family endonuclease
MNLHLDGADSPARISLDGPMGDSELLRFSSENKGLRVERDKTGEIIVTTPAGNRTGMKSLYIGRMLGSWTEEDGRGMRSIRTWASRCQMGRCLFLMLHGC